jgi:hypothetical protein
MVQCATYIHKIRMVNPPIEVLGPGLFTLHPLRLIARKLAILILTQQNVIMDTSLGYDNSGINIKFPHPI